MLLQLCSQLACGVHETCILIYCQSAWQVCLPFISADRGVANSHVSTQLHFKFERCSRSGWLSTCVYCPYKVHFAVLCKAHEVATMLLSLLIGDGTWLEHVVSCLDENVVFKKYTSSLLLMLAGMLKNQWRFTECGTREGIWSWCRMKQMTVLSITVCTNLKQEP